MGSRRWEDADFRRGILDSSRMNIWKMVIKIALKHHSNTSLTKSGGRKALGIGKSSGRRGAGRCICTFSATGDCWPCGELYSWINIIVRTPSQWEIVFANSVVPLTWSPLISDATVSWLWFQQDLFRCHDHLKFWMKMTCSIMPSWSNPCYKLHWDCKLHCISEHMYMEAVINSLHDILSRNAQRCAD